MNVYDFDKTIYNGDSTLDFYLFCVRKHPKILSCIFRQFCGIVLHKLHIIDTTAMKQQFFSFLSKLDDIDVLISAFWQQKQKKMKHWYLQQKDPSDVIISASPAFLLNPICNILDVSHPIATQINKRNGTIKGLNCKGQEKVCRFLEQYPDNTIEQFYSDSKTDTPLANLAEQAFLVKGERLLPWTWQKDETEK